MESVARYIESRDDIPSLSPALATLALETVGLRWWAHRKVIIPNVDHCVLLDLTLGFRLDQLRQFLLPRQLLLRALGLWTGRKRTSAVMYRYEGANDIFLGVVNALRMDMMVVC